MFTDLISKNDVMKPNSIESGRQLQRPEMLLFSPEDNATVSGPQENV